MSKSMRLIIAGVAVILVTASVVIVSRSKRTSQANVKLRVEVTPQEQAGFVAAQMGSARFKYLTGKLAGVPPAEAQKLLATLHPNSPVVDGAIYIKDRAAAEKYIAGFLETLQLVCGTQAQVSVTETSIR